MWKLYKKRAMTQMRLYQVGEDLDGISIQPNYEPKQGDMIARRYEDPRDQWLISEEAFKRDYELVVNE